MASLLIEIQTEELPPKALDNLSKAFAKELAFSLKEQDLALPNAQVTAYGSPRRIAALISDVSEVAPDKPFRQKLVPVKVGLDAEGKATPALSKKMKALGIECEPSELKVVNDGKQDQLVYEGTKAGVSLKDGLQIALDHAVRRLPIPKVMSYQLENGKTVEFVRPVKHLVALFDKEIVPVELFGLKAGRETMGHRFHVHEPISIKEAEKYAEQMEKEGKIVASFEERKNKMVGALKSAAEKLHAEIIMPDDLVNEVTALTEWPVVYESGFDEEFLTVPVECLILTMQQNQKYFALKDQNKKLMNRFLLVSQIEAKDGGEAIRSGNARVVRARLADAKFFYDQDRFQTLESRVPGLAHVVYHNKLGTQLERSERVQKIASRIAEQIGADPALARRAAKLAKADLRTLMVGEFPELQGIMGEYYAHHDKEDDKVALAIREHYQPRYAGDELPSTPESLAVALADKIETLTGLFGIGQLPTGEKDPFALRRHAHGILRLLIEKELPLSLDNLIAIGTEEESVVPGVKDATEELKQFFHDRLRVMQKDQGFTAHEVESVIGSEPAILADVPKRLKAVHDFMSLPEAESLAAANKRIENILKKNTLPLADAVDPALLTEKEEKDLYEAIRTLEPKLEADYKAGRYEDELRSLAPLKAPVDAFFDKVMVNAEDEALRRNRLTLLNELHKAMNQVAKLSCLAS